MAQETTTRVKARRKCGEKSRRGCSTCKIRRVKCDETRPQCHRCTSTGRRCDGPISYECQFVPHGSSSPPPLKISSPNPSMQRTLTSSKLKRDERRAFNFFLERAAPGLSGSLDTFFWERLIPQLTESEPVVKNAVMAISSLYEHPFDPSSAATESGSSPVTDLNRRKALEWYNTAIANFNDIQRGNTQHLVVALASCILFICIELQQDGFFNAISLLEKGIALHSTSLASAAVTYEGLSCVDETIAQLLSRLAGLASVFGLQTPPNWSVYALNKHALTTRMSSFTTLHEARFLMETLKDDCHAFLRLANEHLRGIALTILDLKSRQQELLASLNEWETTFNKIEIPNSSEAVAAGSRLSMIHGTLHIILSTHLNPYQAAFDEHHATFERIVDQAQLCLQEETVKTPFTMNIGLILPLHFVACKCRQPQLRRRALSLLKMCPAKEAWWRAKAHHELAEKAIMVEELSNGRLVEFPVQYGETQGEALTYETKRIYHLEVIEESDGGDELKVSLQAGQYLDEDFWRYTRQTMVGDELIAAY